MHTEKEKLNVLKLNGYNYIFDRKLYFNREKRKIFSREAIEDHNVTWLQEKINEKNTYNVMVYFNGPIDEETIAELKQVFNL
jgi:hypothetical protein